MNLLTVYEQEKSFICMHVEAFCKERPPQTARGKGLYISLINGGRGEGLGLQWERMEGSDKACLHNFLECPVTKGQSPP